MKTSAFKRKWPFFVLISAALFLVSGCVSSKTVKIQPSMEPYVFLQDIKPIAEHAGHLYKEVGENQPLLSARFSVPDAYTIEFYNNWPQVIGEPVSEEIDDIKTFQFRQGVYPFSLYKNKNDSRKYSGMLVVYNIDETIELATFGESDETRMLNEAMFEQARKGILGNYTVSFDNKDVMTYWIGNRDDLYHGGRPTVEVDFSNTRGLSVLKIDGEVAKNFTKVLNLDKEFVCIHCGENHLEENDFNGNCPKDKDGYHKLATRVGHRNYPIEMTKTDGTRYQGYIRNMTSSIFTAFMSLPCEIPEKLFEDAARGTIAKLTVYSAGQDKKEVVEIIFGLAK